MYVPLDSYITEHNVLATQTTLPCCRSVNKYYLYIFSVAERNMVSEPSENFISFIFQRARLIKGLVMWPFAQYCQKIAYQQQLLCALMYSNCIIC